MADGIFIEQNGKLVNMVPTPYLSEDLLQGLLEKHSALLAGDQLTPESEPRRFVLVRREAGIPDAAVAANRWSIDHVFLDQDGVPTLVEVKRSTDTRIRREVVGQMLDYAANAIVYWPAERLREEFEATHEAADGGWFDQLRFLFDDSELSFEDGQGRVDALWKQVQTNLAAGRVRLIFLADELPTELRRIIEFLNQQMSPADVIGIELRNYEGGDGLRALVPRVFGLTEAAKDHKRVGQSSITVEQLWAEAEVDVGMVRSKLDVWADVHGLEAKDLGKSRKYSIPGNPHALMYIYPGSSYRSVYFTLSDLSPGDAEQIRSALSAIAERQVTSKDPGLLCSVVVNNWDRVQHEVLEPFLAASVKN